MEPFIITLIIGLIITGVGTVSGVFLKKRIDKKSKIQKLEERIDKLEKKVEIEHKANWRLKKTALIQAKILDAQMSKYHDEEIPDLVNITKELLDEEPES